MERPTVGDMFCGAGGFSEGFRQAGFTVRWAFDNWKPAYETYGKNFPEAEMFTDDISSFDFVKAAERLKPVDVLIGSPPCQNFSLANRGGNGDIRRGLELVAKFLEAVEALAPRYWIMENVPNIGPTLERAWKLNPKRFSVEGMERYFPPANRKVLDSSLFGVPQKRRRLFSGRFPSPVPSQTPPMPMGDVIDGLPYPIPNGPGGRRPTTIKDPIYGVEVRVANLTDHFMDTTMDQHHISKSKREKQHHRWAGRMKFPDDFKSPSRTICATSQKSGRQAIVIHDPRGGGVYRTPTLRECASLQGFPIAYQFWGSTAVNKQTLIGNAVPPPVARALATAILEQMGRGHASSPVLTPPKELPPEIKNGHRREHRFSLLRPYRHFVPGTLASCRVELDNQGSQPRKHPCGEGRHLREWRVVLYLGYAREYAGFQLDFDVAKGVAIAVLGSATETLDAHLPEGVLDRVIHKTLTELGGGIPDASSLQAAWADRLSSSHDPDWVLNKVSEICRSIVGRPTLGTGVEARKFASLLRGRLMSEGKDSGSGKWKEELVTPYAACSAVALSMAAVLANKGVEWLRENWDRHYDDSSILSSGPFPEALRGWRDATLFADYVLA